MNTAILLMSSALMAGADPAPVAGVVTGNCSSCSAPAATCDTGCSKVTILDRIRGRIATIKSKFAIKPLSSCNSCEAAPTCNTCSTPAPAPTCSSCTAPAKPLISLPLFTGSSCNTCDPCHAKFGLFDKIRARLASFGRGNCDSCSAPASTCSSCASPATSEAPVGCAPSTGVIAPSTTTPVETPKEMPKPMKEEPKKVEPKKAEPKKADPKKTTTLETLPSTTPVTELPSIPELGGRTSKY